MERIDSQGISLHDAVQQAVWFDAHRVRSPVTAHVLTVLQRLLAVALCIDILEIVPAQRCRQHLDAPADAQDGQLALVGMLHEPHLLDIPFGTDAVQSRYRLFAQEQWIEVATA